MKKIIIPILLLFFTLSGFAQISVKEILLSAKKERSLKRHQQQMDFIGNKTTKTPWLDGLELRTETKDFAWKEQEFTLRASTKSKAERKAELASQEAVKNIYASNEHILMSEFLQERYDVILEIYYIQNLLKLEKENSKVNRDQLRVLKKSVNLPTFKISDLVKIENEKKEKEREIIQLEEDLAYKKLIISNWTNSKEDIEIQNNFISIDKVIKTARKLKVDYSTHEKIVQRSLNTEQLNRELDLVEAQNKKWMDFYQIKYASSDPTNLRSDISLGIGLNIPLKKAGQLKVNEIRIEKLVDENNIVLIKEELEENKKFILAQMETKYRLYNLLVYQIQNSLSETIYQNYRKSGGTSPDILLEIKKSDLKTQYELFEIEQSIYSLYFDLLVTTGRMAKAPYVNYLSEGLERF